MSISVVRICRYPVKGLSVEDLERVMLTVGQCLPQDRRFALAHAATDFDPTRAAWLPKTNFLMLMRNEKLAQLRTRFDEQTGYFTIERDGQLLLKAEIADPSQRDSINEFFADFLRDSVNGTPRVVEAAGHTFSDARQKPNSTTYQYVSVVNLASIRALEQVVGVPVDPIRFRANLYIDGLPAWSEFDWVGSEITVAQARLHIVSRITRCAATTVNPATAECDLDVLIHLQQSFGHVQMGIYGEVIGSGEIVTGDTVLLNQNKFFTSE
ncbi:MAG TPA: MOSC domain-containing protein [Pyrinomonadaceae bacterium]|nr:MOSC domain-containing protein [Pyrinomonadaceae bacterium]